VTPLLSITWLPPDGSGAEGLLLERLLLRRAKQQQPALPASVAMRGRPTNTLPDLGAERLTVALGLAALRDTMLSVGTPAEPGPELPQLIARRVVRAQLCMRAPAAMVATLLGLDARGRPNRRPLADSFEAALGMLEAARPTAEAWLDLPEVLPLDLDVLATAPERSVRLVMGHLGIVAEKPGETEGFVADWVRRRGDVLPAPPLSAAETEAVEERLGPLHARFLAAAAAAEAALPD